MDNDVIQEVVCYEYNGKTYNTYREAKQKQKQDLLNWLKARLIDLLDEKQTDLSSIQSTNELSKDIIFSFIVKNRDRLAPLLKPFIR